MRPLTDHTPKPLLEVQGKKLIDWHISGLIKNQHQQIVINHAWLGQQIVDHLSPLKDQGFNLQFSKEDEALETAGVKTTLISAGKFKVEGNPYSPLDADAQSFMQSRVDDYYAAFTKAVARGRGVSINQVRDSMGQGRVIGAESALAQNMVDGVATLDDVLKKMRRDAKQTIKPGASRIRQARELLALM